MRQRLRLKLRKRLTCHQIDNLEWGAAEADESNNGDSFVESPRLEITFAFRPLSRRTPADYSTMFMVFMIFGSFLEFSVLVKGKAKVVFVLKSILLAINSI